MKHLLPFLLLSVLLVSSTFVKAQESNDWQPIYLQVTGNNEIDGVSAWFKPSDCNGEKVVLVKLQNTNAYAVDITYYQGVFTQELKWIEKRENTIHLTLPAKETLIGECAVENVLMVPLSGFIADGSQFKRFAANEFTVKPIR